MYFLICKLKPGVFECCTFEHPSDSMAWEGTKFHLQHIEEEKRMVALGFEQDRGLANTMLTLPVTAFQNMTLTS